MKKLFYGTFAVTRLGFAHRDKLIEELLIAYNDWYVFILDDDKKYGFITTKTGFSLIKNQNPCGYGRAYHKMHSRGMIPWGFKAVTGR